MRLGTQFKSCDFTPYQVFIDGIIYWHSVGLDEGFRTNYIISFDLKSEKFGEVCLTDRLARAHNLVVAKANESLGLLEYYDVGEMTVCGVWTRKDGANKPFTKIYTVKVEGKSVYYNVMGFRNNGEVLLGMEGDDYKESTIEVYEPSSRHMTGVEIEGKHATSPTWPYMETLLLLHESNSIIH